jgi:MFS superfamily sulfate permease-like transporter
VGDLGRGKDEDRVAHDAAVVLGPASIIDHLPRTYHPRNSVLVKPSSGHWNAIPVRPGARTEDGLTVYRFGTDLYYANAPRLADDVKALTGQGSPLRGMILDSASVDDVDYTAGSVLIHVVEQLHQRNIRFVVSSMVGR